MPDPFEFFRQARKRVETGLFPPGQPPVDMTPSPRVNPYLAPYLAPLGQAERDVRKLIAAGGTVSKEMKRRWDALMELLYTPPGGQL
mgnify:CR=1 FL=1